MSASGDARRFGVEPIFFKLLSRAFVISLRLSSATCIALRTIPHITLGTLRLYPNHGTIKLLGSPCSCIPGKGMMHWK